MYLMLLNNTRGISLRGNPLLVRLDIAGKLLNSASITNPQRLTHRLQHCNVVRHHQHATLELIERLGQSVHGLDIQMVRRFVKNQDVGICKSQASKGDTRLLTSRQQSHLLQTGCSGNTEGTKSATVLLICSSGVVLGHETDSAIGEVKGIDVVLSKESNSEARMLRDQTRGWVQFANEKLENSCLTSTVGSNNSDSRIQLNIQVNVAEQDVVLVVTKSNLRHLHDRWR
ncbi:hypothetical protein HG530_015344 [Fusarium avenaceum]|nr:hypothetical protein HG530_015344 [Fusarium avenaceum]